MTNRDEVKPILKLIFFPIIFIIWAIYRLVHVTYVDSPSFFEYWEEL